jgi:endonuclease/exonuclease/phosphatase (EEP) superfamily protein YafD
MLAPMLRRFFAAAILVILALALLVVAWPQLFSVQRAPGVAQLVSLRGLAVAVAVGAIVFLVFVVVLSHRARRFAASVAVLLVVFALLNTVVLSARGIGSLGFATAAPRSVTVLAWNTLGDAPGADAIAEVAIETGADVVALPETTAAVGQAVAQAMGLNGRPMQSFTIAFDQISKARSTTLLISEALGVYVVDETEPNSSVLPTVIARPADGQGPTILGVHLVAPIPGELAHWSQDLDWIATACSNDNTIIAGDFNSTLDHFAGLATAPGATVGSCVDAASVTDNAAVGTWPTTLPALLGAPIDHIMATPNWTVTGMRVLENYDKHGSDHRPVLAQLTPR